MSANDDRAEEEVTLPLDSSDEQDDANENVPTLGDIAEPTELAETADAGADLADEAAEPTTLPLLDSNGNKPTNFDDVLQALRLWEEAVAEAGDDPLFTPQPTTKSRNELMLLDRGPDMPLVWLDHENKRPVLYPGDVDTWIPGDPTPPFSISPPSEAPYEPAENVGLMRPELVVTMSRAEQHFLAALETRAARIDLRSRQIADERVAYERWSRAAQERAINGDW